LTSNF
jgi:hypothetical protein